MDDRRPLAALAHAAHRHFLPLLVAAYAAAGLWPAPGLTLRSWTFGHLPGGCWLTPPVALLALILFNAGLGAEPARLRGLVRRPAVLLAAFAANLLVPAACIAAAVGALQSWHNPDEVQTLLLGLTLVAAMPVAGSSTAWTQNAGGDLALSLGLVLGTTFLSPLTTPLLLDLLEPLATGAYRRAVDALEGGGTGAFLGWCVLPPVLLGMVARAALGAGRGAPARPAVRLANAAALLTLNYANAAAALPQVLARPDWDFLAVTLAVVAGMCAAGFGAGRLLARALGADAGQRAALMFGLGMTNNGTGLVLASLALADYPGALLPLLGYNLVQHVVAGWVGRRLGPPARGDQ
jgi:BASS family bile acid:Na+ symporter